LLKLCFCIFLKFSEVLLVLNTKKLIVGNGLGFNFLGFFLEKNWLLKTPRGLLRLFSPTELAWKKSCTTSIRIWKPIQLSLHWFMKWNQVYFCKHHAHLLITNSYVRATISFLSNETRRMWFSVLFWMMSKNMFLFHNVKQWWARTYNKTIGITYK